MQYKVQPLCETDVFITTEGSTGEGKRSPGLPHGISIAGRTACQGLQILHQPFRCLHHPPRPSLSLALCCVSHLSSRTSLTFSSWSLRFILLISFPCSDYLHFSPSAAAFIGSIYSAHGSQWNNLHDPSSKNELQGFTFTSLIYLLIWSFRSYLNYPIVTRVTN